MQREVYFHASIFFVMAFFLFSCGGLIGNHSLGNNFSLLEGDRLEDRVIVYCYGGNSIDCRGGAYIVPTYERHYENNKYAEYVETAKSNNKWIIAKSIQVKDKKENYWIINKDFDIRNFNCKEVNCDSIILTYVTGPLSFVDFRQKVKELEVDMQIE